MRFDIPVSGLQTNAVRASVAANNIVNVRSVESSALPDLVPFRPSRVEAVSGVNGGVSADVRLREGRPVPQGLSGGLAGASGIEAQSNVSLEQEIVDLKVASTAYKANAAVVRTFDELSDTLLDTVGRRDEED
ncbi:flagellar basal body rod C-terminal domain-containing protein [Kiloniella sp. b19]|uniref:flagellar basal body rod C-terminal domain-containing protein n=1 Tax=Kiloniella sp. GXU_MW_B19 TaxID=3141326 RepID=UPI0031D39436